MKKLLLSFFATALLSVNASAQCIPDNTLNSTGVYFDKSNVPCLNQPYTQVIQMAIKNDTTVFSFNVKLDSVIISQVKNMPAGLTYQCANTQCKAVALSNTTYTQTCMTLSGTPTVSGDFDIELVADLYVSGGNKLTKSFFIPGSIIQCINGLNTTSTIETVSLFPQPTTNNTQLNINLSAASSVNVSIINPTGSLINTVYNGTMASGLNKLNIGQTTSTLEKGIYLITTSIQTSNGVETFSKKLIVE